MRRSCTPVAPHVSPGAGTPPVASARGVGADRLLVFIAVRWWWRRSIQARGLADRHVEIPTSRSCSTQFKQSKEVWDAHDDVREHTYAPFNIGVTDVDPGHGAALRERRRRRPRSSIRPRSAGGVRRSPATRSRTRCRSRSTSTAPSSLAVLDRRAGDRALVRPRARVQRVRSDDLSERRTVDEAVPGDRLAVRRVQRDRAAAAAPSAADAELVQAHPRLFGPGAATPPTVTMKAPTNGKKVHARIPHQRDCGRGHRADRAGKHTPITHASVPEQPLDAVHGGPTVTGSMRSPARPGRRTR